MIKIIPQLQMFPKSCEFIMKELRLINVHTLASL